MDGNGAAFWANAPRAPRRTHASQIRDPNLYDMMRDNDDDDDLIPVSVNKTLLSREP